jgi:hypothetical protein
VVAYGAGVSVLKSHDPVVSPVIVGFFSTKLAGAEALVEN